MTSRARTAVRILALALVAGAIPSGVAAASTAQLGVTGGTIAMVEVRFVTGPAAAGSTGCPPVALALVTGNTEWVILTEPLAVDADAGADCPPAVIPLVSLVAPL